MGDPVIYCAGTTAAARYAAIALGERGFSVTYEPCSDAQYVLLDVPSLGQNDQLRGGMPLPELLERIPDKAILLGGNLDHPLLYEYRKIDLLKDETYLQENARITAYCALQVISEALAVTIEEAKILVIGWGRIGKILSSLLIRLGADVTIASGDARKIATLKALGAAAIDTGSIHPGEFTAIINTAPAHILSAEALKNCPSAAKIDLASVKGLGGTDVIWARGLPGIHAPESSGKLIARCVASRIKEALL